MFIYPRSLPQVVLNNLLKEVTQLEASMNINAEKGRVRDPGHGSCATGRRRAA